MSTTVAAAAIYPVTPIVPGPLSGIARAIQARLQLGFPLTRFQYAVVPPKVTPEVWKNLMRKTPFVGIGWNALVEGRSSGRLFAGQSNWSIFLAVRNQNSIDARFFGDSQGPGLFTMVQAAVGLLHGYTIDGFGSVEVTQASNAYAENFEDDAALAIVDLSVNTTLGLPDVVGPPDDLGLFQTLFATWNLDGADENTDQIAVGEWAVRSD